MVRSLWILALAAMASAQPISNVARHIYYGSSLPANCNPSTGDVFFKTSATVGPYYCSAANTWTAIGGGGGGGTGTATTVGTPSDLTSVAAAQTTPVSLATGLTAGHYVLNFDIVQNALASSGSCTYTFTFTYTNEVATETFTATGVALGATHSNSTNGIRPMNLGGAGTVSYVSALASGTCNGATYNPHIWVESQ